MYLPFGESYVDQRSSGFGSRYQFSAKEKDAESGYHYFGARYYDSDLSVWLSVDPMEAAYPFISPYNYCLSKPTKMHDPDGNSPIDRAQKYKKKHGGLIDTWIGKNGREYASVDKVVKEGVTSKVYKENVFEYGSRILKRFIPNINVTLDGGSGSELYRADRHESIWKDINFDMNVFKELIDLISLTTNNGSIRVKRPNGIDTRYRRKPDPNDKNPSDIPNMKDVTAEYEKLFKDSVDMPVICGRTGRIMGWQRCLPISSYKGRVLKENELKISNSSSK
jgi:RHS repeat-associated protein